jgi:signal transduction histidine kinase
MTYTHAMRSALSDYFAADHLPMRQQIATRTLMRTYALGSTLMCYVAVFNLVIYGFEGHEVKIITQFFAMGSLLGVLEVTRRGHGNHAGWVFGLLTLALVIQRTLAQGELNAMVCTLLLPIIVFSFVHARRSLLAYASLCYMTLIALASTIHVLRPLDAPAPHYLLSSTLITLTLILFDVLIVTWLVMHIEQESLNRVLASTIAMEEAQQKAIVESIATESARHEVLLTQRAKARYLANMSHELRTPLSTIISYSELLDESLEECSEAPDHTRRDVTRIKRSGEHVLRRINDILDLSRLEADKMPVHEEPVLLNTLFEQADKFAHERASTDQRARLKITWPDPTQLEGIEVLCDELLTMKLLAHLMLHLKEDGPVSVFIVPHQAQLDVIFKLRFWTLPPDSNDMTSINPGHLHLLLYRALLNTLGLPFEEPTSTHNRPWKITLNAMG